MTFYVENECGAEFEFSIEKTIEMVIKAACEYVKCPYEAEVSVLITDEEGIHAYNREYRDIDRPTDVLSFPAVDYDAPMDFSYVVEDPNAYLNPETQELMLGDIILCKERILSQAEEYGHSVYREFAFLITHSMLHLFGFDHMTPEEEKEMFSCQEDILNQLQILR